MIDNKIENKLLHYKTKAAFEADKKRIKDTSIAFVDEDLIIYTHGKYYSVGIDQKLAEVYQNVNEIIAEFESNINSAVDSLRAEALENHQAAIQQARAGIEEAKSKIQQLQDSLANYAPITEIQQIQGRISAITDWFSVQEGKFTRLEQQLDALDAKIITRAQYIQLATEQARAIVNEYSQTVDLALAQLSEEISSTNVESLTQSVVGRLMDAENGVLKDYATVTWVNSQLDNLDTSNIVQAVFNAMEPSWSVLVQRVNTNTSTGDALTQEISRLWVEANKISGLTTSVDDHTSRIAALELNSGQGQASVTLAAILDVLDSDTQRRIASEIFLTANESGSGITLSADKIDLTGDTSVLGTFIASVINASQINAKSLTIGSGSNFIKGDYTGLYHINTSTNRNSFKLNTDGSGQLGYVITNDGVNDVYTPAITWTSTGILSINSAVIGGGGGGGGTTYVENPYDDTALQNRLDTIEAWKTATASWITQMNNNNSARAYLTATGIVFDNIQNQGHIVAVTSEAYNASRAIPAGITHTRISDGKHGYYLNNDGSGELAFGNITWDSQGNLYAKNLILDANSSSVGNSSIIFEITSWFEKFITYRIIKNGFVVKVGEEDNIRVENLVQDNIIRAEKTIISHGTTYDNTTYDTYDIYAYNAETVSRQSLTNWIQRWLKKSMFVDPNDSTVNLISPGDSVFVKLPENRYYNYSTNIHYSYDIADIGGPYNDNGVTISTSEELRDYVYDYFTGVHQNDTVIYDLIQLAIEQDKQKFIAEHLVSHITYRSFVDKQIVDVVTDPNTQISWEDYYAYIWENPYPTANHDNTNSSYNTNLRKFAKGHPAEIRTQPLLVAESTIITWPSITY